MYLVRLMYLLCRTRNVFIVYGLNHQTRFFFRGDEQSCILMREKKSPLTFLSTFLQAYCYQ